jgi:hypothetical protein
MVIAWGSPVIRQLLADERTELLHLRYADAYIALFPFLTKVVVPAGVADIEKNRPATDVTLVSAKASLIVRKELHPAIQYILLNAAAQVHSGPGMFQRAGQFPAAEGSEVALSDDAFQYYKSGRPFLQNYLPFWMAALVSRLLILLIPVLGVLYPIVRFMPVLYDWAVRRRISHLYRELRVLEYELEALRVENGADKMAAQLERLEQRANHLKIPIAYAGTLYMLRNHIALVRERLRAYSHREPGHAAPDDPRPAT